MLSGEAPPDWRREGLRSVVLPKCYTRSRSPGGPHATPYSFHGPSSFHKHTRTNLSRYRKHRLLQLLRCGGGGHRGTPPLDGTGLAPAADGRLPASTTYRAAALSGGSVQAIHLGTAPPTLRYTRATPRDNQPELAYLCTRGQCSSESPYVACPCMTVHRNSHMPTLGNNGVCGFITVPPCTSPHAYAVDALCPPGAMP